MAHRVPLKNKVLRLVLSIPGVLYILGIFGRTPTIDDGSLERPNERNGENFLHSTAASHMSESLDEQEVDVMTASIPYESAEGDQLELRPWTVKPTSLEAAGLDNLGDRSNSGPPRMRSLPSNPLARLNGASVSSNSSSTRPSLAASEPVEGMHWQKQHGWRWRRSVAPRRGAEADANVGAELV